jgi:hypothetical protein
VELRVGPRSGWARRDAKDLADLLQLGRLPEAWTAPPAARELRERVRHRAKLVSMRSRYKTQVHAVLAKCGVQILMSDLFGAAGTGLLNSLDLPKPVGRQDRLPAADHGRPGLRDRPARGAGRRAATA